LITGHGHGKRGTKEGKLLGCELRESQKCGERLKRGWQTKSESGRSPVKNLLGGQKLATIFIRGGGYILPSREINGQGGTEKSHKEGGGGKVLFCLVLAVKNLTPTERGIFVKGEFNIQVVGPRTGSPNPDNQQLKKKTGRKI